MNHNQISPLQLAATAISQKSHFYDGLEAVFTQAARNRSLPDGMKFSHTIEGNKESANITMPDAHISVTFKTTYGRANCRTTINIDEDYPEATKVERDADILDDLGAGMKQIPCASKNHVSQSTVSRAKNAAESMDIE